MVKEESFEEKVEHGILIKKVRVERNKNILKL